jgi:uncharacterized membrane protein
VAEFHINDSLSLTILHTFYWISCMHIKHLHPFHRYIHWLQTMTWYNIDHYPIICFLWYICIYICVCGVCVCVCVCVCVYVCIYIISYAQVKSSGPDVLDLQHLTLVNVTVDDVTRYTCRTFDKNGLGQYTYHWLTVLPGIVHLI